MFRNKEIRCFLHEFNYPVYSVHVAGRTGLVVAGGGGASKTGVPNRIDVVDLDFDYKHSITSGKSESCLPTAENICGTDTGPEAVMNLRVANSGDRAFIISIEGGKCVEYVARPKYSEDFCDSTVNSIFKNENGTISSKKDFTQINQQPVSEIRHRPVLEKREAPDCGKTPQSERKKKEMTLGSWELTRLREFSPNEQMTHKTAAQGNNLLSCLAIGGPGGCWLAVGSDTGAVYLINRHTVGTNCLSKIDTLEPSFYCPDISGNHGASVCDLDIIVPSGTTPLVATLSDRPGWNVLHIWTLPSSSKPRTPQTLKARRKFPSKTDHVFSLSASTQQTARLMLYAKASYDNVSLDTSSSTTASTDNQPADRVSYRLKHCRFLPDCTGESVRLVTTVQPLGSSRGHRRRPGADTSRIVVWTVRKPGSSVTEQPDTEPNRLTAVWAEAQLPIGHLPACLAVHPSRARALIAVGTMEGRIEVFLLGPDRRLTCVYTVPVAHPIFVTALTFLPVCVTAASSSCELSISPQDSFQLVSVSVDRKLYWYQGPSFVQLSSQKAWPLALMLLMIMMMMPLWLCVLDRMLSWFV